MSITQMKRMASPHAYLIVEPVEKVSKQILGRNTEKNELTECATINDLMLGKGQQTIPKTTRQSGPRGFSTVSLCIRKEVLVGLSNNNFGKKDQDRSSTMGKRMSDLVFSLCNHNETEKFIKKNQFGNTEADRFKFCLLFFNTANVIFWVNYAMNPKSQDILDVMLEEITNKMSNDERHIRVGDYILKENELKLFDSKANENTETNFYTIFDCLYDERINQYTDAIFQQMELAFKAKESKNKKEFFALDPMGKLFVYHFTGEEFKKKPQLYMSVSLLLATYSQVIANGVSEILKGTL